MFHLTAAYFDTCTYTCCFEHELPPEADKSQLLRLPQIGEKPLVNLYIHQSKATEKAFRKISESSKDLCQEFHWKINDDGLYDEWCDFRDDALCDIAEKWCEENSIQFTRKKLSGW